MKIIKTYWGDKEQEIISEKEISEIVSTNEIKRVFKGLKEIKYFSFKTEGRFYILYGLRKSAPKKYYMSLLNHKIAFKNDTLVFLEDINFVEDKPENKSNPRSENYLYNYKNNVLTDDTLKLFS